MLSPASALESLSLPQRKTALPEPMASLTSRFENSCDFPPSSSTAGPSLRPIASIRHIGKSAAGIALIRARSVEHVVDCRVDRAEGVYPARSLRQPDK